MHLLRRVSDGWEAIDQAIHGDDFWQTEHDPDAATWTRIHNVDLGLTAGPTRFRVRPEGGG
jgi:hypothetical protein